MPVDSPISFFKGVSQVFKLFVLILYNCRKFSDANEEEEKPFRDKLIEKMGYKKRRSDFYPKYFQKLGVKACVYCNSQLTVTVNSYEYKKDGSIKQDEVKEKFQVDHYLPKSEYPCFSISLFNLFALHVIIARVQSTSTLIFMPKKVQRT